MLDTPLTNQLTRYMDLTARRESLIAGNIANIDTPGYKSKDVDFSKELQRIMTGAAGDTSKAAAINTPGLLERPDGNNVSMEREGMLLGQTQLEFQSAAQLLKSQFHLLQSAIKEGSAQ